MVAIVGKMRPPQMVRVNETGSELDVYVNAGVRGRCWLLTFGNMTLINGNFVECLSQNLSKASSHRINRPSISMTGIAGKPINMINGSAFSITLRPSLWPSTCMIVTAPYVTAVQYTEPTRIPPARNGHTFEMILSNVSNMRTNKPLFGYKMM